jgi:hypothetical protein
MKYIVVAPNYWGQGESQADAVEQMLAAGGSVEQGYSLYELAEGTRLDSVDDIHGTVRLVTETGEDWHQDVHGPSVRTVSAQEAMTSRIQDITRALVNEDIDAEIAADLRSERNRLRRQMASA